MPSLGSSILPNNLVFSGVNFVTGPTGPTGPQGITGYSLTGPTGSHGPQYVSSNIFGYTLGITYGNVGFFFGITAQSGSSIPLANPNFTVNQIGSISANSLFAGFSASNNYALYFKTIFLSGDVTGGISLDSIYLSSESIVGSTGNNLVGTTGSLFYIATDAAGFGSQINPTNGTTTKYQRNTITRTNGSLLGITLDTFRFKVLQNLDTQGLTLVNLNYININDELWGTSELYDFVNKYGITYSITNNDYSITRTDQSLFSFFKNDTNNHLLPVVSFRAEGITLFGTVTGPVEIKLIGKGITYTNNTYSSKLIGSCCYCAPDAEEEQTIKRDCIDYASKDFCDSINGTFSFSTCNERYLSGDCYSGGVCCVNGTCIETDKSLCSKVFGKFYANIQCKDLPYGCPTNCAFEASCCVAGKCFALPTGDSSEELCDELKGTYKEVPCSERNCCVEGFRGACCLDASICIDDSTPIECVERGGVFQGPTSICSSTICCKDSDTTNNLRMAVIDNSINLPNLQVGDYFGGGIVAGFVGYPPPIGFDVEGYFATGETISEVENNINSNVEQYVAVNGAYNYGLKCNCSNFSPSRYIDVNSLAQNKGKSISSELKSLSGTDSDYYKLSFYNRLSDSCLPRSTKQCSHNGLENRKYGFNSVEAYKKLSKQIYGDAIPNAWILIVSPEDFYTNYNKLSFGMSMSVDGFTVPNNLSNYSTLLWQNNILTPYGTSAFDGLVNTRVFDQTSIERNNWFISNTYAVNGSLTNYDPLAYSRFKHTYVNYWDSSVDSNLLTVDGNYFKEKYKELWTRVNDENTVLYNISKQNNENYNGYSDWYVPSALELNMIYNNMEKINRGILLNDRNTGWNLLSQDSMYWSSTTGGRITSLKENGTKYYDKGNSSFENDIPFTSSDTILDSWKRLKMAQAHRAFAQRFSNGSMVSILKTDAFARLRACRMIPIYFKNEDLSNQFEQSHKSLETCSSCR